jgi:hypothetical protein
MSRSPTEHGFWMPAGIADIGKFKIGVCWMLTESDGRGQ